MEGGVRDAYYGGGTWVVRGETTTVGTGCSEDDPQPLWEEEHFGTDEGDVAALALPSTQFDTHTPTSGCKRGKGNR